MNQPSISYDPVGFPGFISHVPSHIQRYSHSASSYPVETNHLAVAPSSYQQSSQVTVPIPRKDLKRLVDSLDLVDSIAKMAEPLSVLASMIAVSEASMKIAKSLYSFATALRSSADDIERLAFELDTFSGVLDDLHAWLKDNQQVISQSGLDTANKILRRCKKTFNDIKKMIGTGADEHFDPPRFWNRIRLAGYKKAPELDESSKPRSLEEKKLRVRVEHNVVNTQHSLVRWQRAEFDNQHIPYPSASYSPHDSSWLLSLVPSLKLPAIPHTPYPMLPSPDADKKEREKEKRRMNETVKTLLSAWTNINEGHDRRWTVDQPRKQGRKPRNLENPLHSEPGVKDKQAMGEAISSHHNAQWQRVENGSPAKASHDRSDKLAQDSQNRQGSEAIHDPEKREPESRDAPQTPPRDDDNKKRTSIDEADPNETEELEEGIPGDKRKDPMETKHSHSCSPSIATIDLTQDGMHTGQAGPLLQASQEGDRMSNLRPKPGLNINVGGGGPPGKASSKSRERRILSQEAQNHTKRSKSSTSPLGSRESVDSFANFPPAEFPPFYPEQDQPRVSQVDHGSNLHMNSTSATQYYPQSHAMMPYGPTGYVATRSHMSSMPSFPTAPSTLGDSRFAPSGSYAYPYDQSAYGANTGMDYAGGFVPKSNTSKPYKGGRYPYSARVASTSPTISTTSLPNSDEEVPALSQSPKHKGKANLSQDEILKHLEDSLTKYRQEEIQRFQDSFAAFVNAQHAANSAQRAHQQEVQAAIRSAAEEARRQSILRLISADGKRFQFPFASCRTWKEMKLLIEKAHRQNYPKLDIDDHTSFFLTEGQGNFILPDLWEDTVAPGSTITVRLRTLEEEHSDSAYDGASEQAEFPEVDRSEISSSTHTNDLPRSSNHGGDLDAPREDQKTRIRQRNVSVDKPPPVPTPPPAVPRSTRRPSSSDESSSNEEDSSPNRPHSREAVPTRDAKTAAQRSSVRGRTDMYEDLNSHLHQVMDAEVSVAKLKAKQKITSMLTLDHVSNSQAHEPSASNSVAGSNGPSAIPHMYGGISSSQDAQLDSSETPQILITSNRHSTASHQTHSPYVTPNTLSDGSVGFPQVSPRHHALENGVPGIHSTLTDPTSPQPQITTVSQKTAVEVKLDYLTSLITKREQNDRARDVVAKQAADEEKLKQLEDKLLRSTDIQKDQVGQTSSIAGSSTLNESSTGNPVEKASARPSLAAAGNGSSIGHSFGRRSFRRRFLGRSTSTSAVTP